MELVRDIEELWNFSNFVLIHVFLPTRRSKLVISDMSLGNAIGVFRKQIVLKNIICCRLFIYNCQKLSHL